MPKKRITAWSRNKKEKQILTARLMEISLKIEDYIYNHKLISVCEAKQYMREVSSYKTLCCQDERSLQVIEKITRCMQAIILDHQELTPNIHNENDGSSIANSDYRAGSISPVYSIADEDRTQLTQIAEARPVNITVANEDVGIINVSNIDDDNDITHSETKTATADSAGSKITVEVDIHRRMPSLSLRDVESTFISSSDINCSQSILNNFEDVAQMRQNVFNIVSQGAVTGRILDNVADGGKPRNVMPVGGNATFGIPNKTTSIIEPNKTSTTPNKIALFNTTKHYKLVQNKEPLKEINNTNCSLTMTSNQKDNTISSQTKMFMLVANEEFRMIDLSNIDDHDDIIQNETSTATADSAGSKITDEVDIHRGMPSLSLRDVKSPFISSSDINCSQSILNNFEDVAQMQQNVINIVSQGAVTGRMLDNVADEGKTRNVMSVGGNATLGIPNKTTSIIEPNKTSITPNKIVLFNTNKQYKAFENEELLKKDSNTNCSLTMTSNQKDNTIASQTFYSGSVNIPDGHRKNWYDSNRTCTINNSTHTLKDANQFTKPVQIYKVVNPITVKKSANINVYIPTNTYNAAEKENQPNNASETSRALINNTAIGQNDSTTIKKKRAPRKKKTLDEKEIKPKRKRVYRAPKNNKEKTLTNLGTNKAIPIYNENVINDLSWIENIRFVREIQVDEYDPKLKLEECFWDNYLLPANWSENEFF